jgi:hypothetical protein
MSEEKTSETTLQEPRPSHSRSVFAPIILIAAGVFFLLDNLSLLPALNWSLVLRFWPLFLVFVGLNILVVQVRPPAGTFLSLLTALLTVGVFGALLLSNPANQIFDRFGITLPSTDIITEPFEVGAEGVTAAEIQMDFSNYPSVIASSSGEDHLVSGIIRSASGLDLDSEMNRNGQATVRLGEKAMTTFSMDPMRFAGSENNWEIYLNRQTPTDLMLDVSNGYVNSQLADLNLTHLVMNGGNGTLEAALPAGNYDIKVDGGNGRIEVTLPTAGRQAMEVDGGNGRITLTLPASMEARVQFNKGRGNIDVDSRFRLISGDRDRGVYQTGDYENAPDRILILLDSGNGRVSIQEP